MAACRNGEVLFFAKQSRKLNSETTNHKEKAPACPGAIAPKARKKSSPCEHTRTPPHKKSKAGPQDLNK